MEGVIGNIVSKIDKVLIKLESMEKSKSKKKQNLGKLFDGLTNDDEGKDNFRELCNKQSLKFTQQLQTRKLQKSERVSLEFFLSYLPCQYSVWMTGFVNSVGIFICP